MMKLVLSEEQVEELSVFISKGKKYGGRASCRGQNNYR